MWPITKWLSLIKVHLVLQMLIKHECPFTNVNIVKNVANYTLIQYFLHNNYPRC